jgi:hypothetical protein
MNTKSEKPFIDEVRDVMMRSGDKVCGACRHCCTHVVMPAVCVHPDRTIEYINNLEQPACEMFDKQQD